VSQHILDHLSGADAVLGGLIRAVGPYVIELDGECHPFQALAQAIAHQQLNGTAANTILKRLIHSCGAGAFPTPQMVLAASAHTLRAAGFSFAKVAALRDLAQKTLADVVPEASALLQLSDEEIIARLTQVRGIGLSGQMHGAVLLDAQDRVLRPAILWNDMRSVDECAELTERAELGHAPAVQGVTLASIHAAKGLEWDAVLLPGLVEGLMPIVYAKTPEAIEEERRLLYVAVTRARQHLYLSWSPARTPAGQGRVAARQRSRFLDDLRLGRR